MRHLLALAEAELRLCDSCPLPLVYRLLAHDVTNNLRVNAHAATPRCSIVGCPTYRTEQSQSRPLRAATTQPRRDMRPPSPLRCRTAFASPTKVPAPTPKSRSYSATQEVVQRGTTIAGGSGTATRRRRGWKGERLGMSNKTSQIILLWSKSTTSPRLCRDHRAAKQARVVREKRADKSAKNINKQNAVQDSEGNE